MTDDTVYRVTSTAEGAATVLLADALAWKVAQEIAWGPADYVTRFRALWSEEGLFVRFAAADPSPWSTMRRHDDHLWEEEVVEIFIDPDRSGRNYAEVEISPANVLCDVRMRSPWPDKVMDLAWHFAGVDTRVIHRRDERNSPLEWVATAALPWPGFASLPCRASLPPALGDAWAFNVFRIKRPGGPNRPSDGAVLAAWSPTGTPSFHVPAVFRPLVFDGPST